MRFTPKAPDETVNYSRENPLREALTLVVIVAAVGTAALLSAGYGAEAVMVRTPPAWESRLFGFMARQFPEADDPRTARTAALAASLDPGSAERLQLRVIDDTQLNAFAAPGGLIVVTTGLLDAVESENELAFVLAHEMGHFRHRDHLRALGRGLASSLALAALSAVAGADVSSLTWIQELTELRFSRDQEREADEWGLDLVARRYSHVHGATAFLERLPRAESAAARGAASFLSTHPVSAERIERLRTLASERGWNASGALAAFP